MLWVSFQFASLDKKTDSKTSRTKLKRQVGKLSKDTHFSLNHLVLRYKTCLIERMAPAALGPTSHHFTALKSRIKLNLSEHSNNCIMCEIAAFNVTNKDKESENSFTLHISVKVWTARKIQHKSAFEVKGKHSTFLFLGTPELNKTEYFHTPMHMSTCAHTQTSYIL